MNEKYFRPRDEQKYVRDKHSTPNSHISRIEKLEFNQVPDWDPTLPEPYPEGLDPESLDSWLHKFTAVSVVRNYLVTMIEKGDMEIRITHPRISKGALLFDFGKDLVATFNFDPDTHDDRIPFINTNDAIQLISRISADESRSLKGTWLHEKRTSRTMFDESELDARIIPLAALMNFTGIMQHTSPEELFSGMPELLKHLDSDYAKQLLADIEENLFTSQPTKPKHREIF